MIKNELIISELKKCTEYGCNLLVKKFFEKSKRAIAAYFKIQYADTGPIVNAALLKIIDNIKSFNYNSDKQFDIYISKSVFNAARDYLGIQNRSKNIFKNSDLSLMPYVESDFTREINSVANVEEEEEIVESYRTFPGDLNNIDENDKQEIDLVQDTIVAEFICDTDTIKENEKQIFVKEILNSFKQDDEILLRLHLNGISHKELALIRHSSEEATRKYVNRLLHTFLKEQEIN